MDILNCNADLRAHRRRNGTDVQRRWGNHNLRVRGKRARRIQNTHLRLDSLARRRALEIATDPALFRRRRHFREEQAGNKSRICTVTPLNLEAATWNFVDSESRRVDSHRTKLARILSRGIDSVEMQATSTKPPATVIAAPATKTALVTHAQR